MDYYRFFPVLYQADTIHLTLAQDGAYRRLIDHYMLTRQPLPDNDGALARIVGCGVAEWLEIAPSIRPFFKRQNGLLHNKRCNAELDWQDNKLKTRKEIAQKGVEARRNKIKGLATNGQPTVNRDVTRGEERRGEEIRKEEVSTPLPPKGKSVLGLPGFDAFWAMYPLRVGKGAARKAYAAALKKTTPEAIAEGLARYKRPDDPKFIPHPSSWLNGERWNDEPEPLSRREATLAALDAAGRGANDGRLVPQGRPGPGLDNGGYQDAGKLLPGTAGEGSAHRPFQSPQGAAVDPDPVRLDGGSQRTADPDKVRSLLAFTGRTLQTGR